MNEDINCEYCNNFIGEMWSNLEAILLTLLHVSRFILSFTCESKAARSWKEFELQKNTTLRGKKSKGRKYRLGLKTAGPQKNHNGKKNAAKQGRK